MEMMLVTSLIWHIYKKGMSSGFVEIDPGFMLLDQGEAAGYYYSGCYFDEFDFEAAPLWLVERAMSMEPIPIHKAKDLYIALCEWVPNFRSLDLDQLRAWE
jgi:hypothetical protein